MRSRRQLLRLVASAIAGFSSVSKSWSNEPAKQYSRAVEQLLTELSVVYSPPQGIQPNADFVDQFLNQELESRKTFFSAISPINPIDIASQLDPAVDYLNVNQFDDVSLMIATSEEVRPGHHRRQRQRKTCQRIYRSISWLQRLLKPALQRLVDKQ